MREDTPTTRLRLVPGEHTAAASPGTVDVAHISEDWYRIRVRDHEFTVDQPTDAGGSDFAPTPVELFIASLAACAGFYAGRYLTRHGLPRDGLEVRAEFDMAEDRPARVAGVRMQVTVPPTSKLTATQMVALRAVVEHCTVHNTLREPPYIRVTVS